MLQIGAALFYYKLGQKLLQIGAVSWLQIKQVLLQIGAAITKLGQPLLQNRAVVTIGAKCITNWGRYYKLGQLLQIAA